MSVPDRCEPVSHLFIAIPSYTGRPTIDMTVALGAACAALTCMKVEVTMQGLPYCPYLDHARNMLATKFMQSRASDLFFWDDDVSPALEAIGRIVAATRPYVGGIYPKKIDPPSWPVAFEQDELYSDADGLVEAAMLPTGFLRLNRLVFETMPHEIYRDDSGNEWMGYFHDGLRLGVYRGEDAGFSQEWRRIGGKCYMIPDLTFGHTGPKTWRGNWGEWMRSRAIVDQRTDYSE